ncbi:glycosyltransferase family 4 protein [Gramella sp. MT6]|nr:glycosyltransferase family 4 protein [Gramella sp. MT6]
MGKLLIELYLLLLKNLADILKKILVIVESLDKDSSSGAKANMALIKNLIEAGFQVKVYHYSRKEIKLGGAESISIPENRKTFFFFLSRVERYIRYIFKFSLNPKIEEKTGFSFTLKNDRNSIVAALRKEKDFKPDWVLTLSQGGSFRPHHALLKIPMWHAKWIAYIHDPYPMHWYPKPYTWKEPGYKLKQRFMEEVADKCQYAAFPSLYLKEWMGSHYQVYLEKGIVIPHQLNNEIERTLSMKVKIDPSEFAILHAGNFLQARQPMGLIEGFKRFVKAKPEASTKLIHIGPAHHYKEYLEKQAQEEAKIQVFCQNHPFSEVAILQEEVSVNIIIEAKAEFSPFLPGKFPHCIAAGKPILLLGPPRSESRRLLGEDYPYYAEIDDAEHIASLLEELYLEWKRGELAVDYSRIKRYLSSAYVKEIIKKL